MALKYKKLIPEEKESSLKYKKLTLLPEGEEIIAQTSGMAFDPERGFYKPEAEKQKEIPKTIEEMFLPRTKELEKKIVSGEIETPNAIRTMSAPILDILSVPGRAVTAGIQQLIPEGEGFAESFGRKEAPEDANIVRKFAENMLRDPATAVTLPFTAGTSSLLKKPAEMTFKGAVKKGAQLLGRGALESIPGAIVHQGERLVETGDIDPLEAAGEVALGGAMDLGLGVTGRVTKEILKGGGNISNKIIRGIFNAPEHIQAMGFKPENVRKYNLFGTMGAIKKKVDGLIEPIMKKIDDEIEKNPSKTIDIIDAIENVNKYFDDPENISKTPTLYIDENALKNANEKINTLISKLGLGTKGMSLKKSQQLKSALRKLTDLDEGVLDSDMQALQLVAGKLHKDVSEKISEQVPELKNYMTELSELIPIQAAARKALKRNPSGIKQVIGESIASPAAEISDIFSKGEPVANLLEKVPAIEDIGGFITRTGAKEERFRKAQDEREKIMEEERKKKEEEERIKQFRMAVGQGKRY